MTIYQLFVRHFGNLKTEKKPNATIEVNGCGKFADITYKALIEIRALGFTHIWFTGILEHSSGTAYEERPADDALILKGIAGSPYAVKDYFDVCPDLSEHPKTRIQEFRDLVNRAHHAGLSVLIDFIPNHVARSYQSDVRPELSFGNDDEKSAFFHMDNHFFYLQSDEVVKLPDGDYPSEKPPRVSGNNAARAELSRSDWYETVKLNYGFNFVVNHKEFDASHRVPKTWKTMDEVLQYWQDLGVDGFRCDMAHMVPVEFWQWAIQKARKRAHNAVFVAEAYDGDPMKVSTGNVLSELLEVGFDLVYDSGSYDLVKGIYESGKWANDLDAILWDPTRLHQMLRYAENHDEVRIASPLHWGGHGAGVGKAAVGYLSAIGRGGCMLYNGQEVGEPAIGVEGFSGDDGKTSIFDYTSLPELQKWVNYYAYDGKGLSEEQCALRAWYGEWFGVMQQPAFKNGEVYGLNFANRENVKFGRFTGEEVSGHWLYAFLRYDKETGQLYLVVINFHPSEAITDIEVWIPEEAQRWADGLLNDRLVVAKLAASEAMAHELSGMKTE